MSLPKYFVFFAVTGGRSEEWRGTQIPTKCCGTNCFGTRSKDAAICPISVPRKRALKGYSIIFLPYSSLFLEFPNMMLHMHSGLDSFSAFDDRLGAEAL